MSILYSCRFNVIRSTLRTILPIQNKEEFVNQKKYLVHNFTSNQSNHVDLEFNSFYFYFFNVINLNYGLGNYSSTLLFRVLGGQYRTYFHFFFFLDNPQQLFSFFTNINHFLYQSHLLDLKRKFQAHSFWSTRYLRKYPCRGQRTRSNGVTSRKLNLIARLNVLKVSKTDKSV